MMRHLLGLYSRPEQMLQIGKKAVHTFDTWIYAEIDASTQRVQRPTLIMFCDPWTHLGTFLCHGWVS